MSQLYNEHFFNAFLHGIQGSKPQGCRKQGSGLQQTAESQLRSERCFTSVVSADALNTDCDVPPSLWCSSVKIAEKCNVQFKTLILILILKIVTFLKKPA